MKYLCTTLALLIISLSANSQSLYFPPVSGDTWDTVSPKSLGWCEQKLDTLIDYIGNTNARAFIILKDGKVAVEKYYGSFTKDSVWYWASAGKSLTAFLVGLAQEKGNLRISDSLPKYLGQGYSSCNAAQENRITIRHQLTMTSGFNDGVAAGPDCTNDTCLKCIAAPGTRWAYHNAPYTLTHEVLESALGTTVNAFKNQQLLGATGISGTFVQSGWNKVYFSKPRAMARFGLLMQAKGTWNGTRIMRDTAYYQHMISSSQTLNPAYGYLWWLNGRPHYRLPGTQLQFNGMIVPHAPADMYAALGRDDQILNVVPSMGLIMVRMGGPMYTSQDVATMANDSIWVRLNEVFCNTASVGPTGSTAAINIYPNPALDCLHINGIAATNGAVVQISDVTGRRVLTAYYTGRPVDVSGLLPGHYIIRITTAAHTYSNRFMRR